MRIPPFTSISLLFVSTLIGAAFIFWPALSGPFLLDDFLHFPKLAENGAVDNLQKLFQFVFSSTNGSGRPISFLSLLINDNTWPSIPWGFKYTNLMIHLLNGVLVFKLTHILTSIVFSKSHTDNEPKCYTVALASMVIWLIHPIQLSPMMLTIQRMTLLMATFTLIGLIVYLHGRWVAQSNPKSGYILMTAGIVVFGSLSVFCKEPGIMIVTYAIAMELTLFSAINLKQPPLWKYWVSIFLIAPLGFIVAYFAADASHMTQLYTKREFNLTERLLTESRVVMSYLKVILMPSLSETGPYHDDFIISQDLLNPFTTLLSLTTIIGALTFSVIYRKNHPLISFSILWFFLAHMLESTILPLELYFEHRNYLPMLGIVIAISYWGIMESKSLKRFALSGIIIFIMFEGGLSTASATVWGDRGKIANIWAHEHPKSMRAQLDAIRYWLDKHNIGMAKQHITLAETNNPNDAGIQLYKFLIDRCSNPDQEKVGGTMENLRQVIPTARFEHASIDGLRFLVKETKKGRCRATHEEILEIADLYLSNPIFYNIGQARGAIYQEKSRIYIQQGDLDKTIKMLDFTYQAVPRFGFPLNQAYLLMSAGLYKDAEHYIDIAKSTKPLNSGEVLWKQKQINEIEKFIRIEKRKQRQQQLNNIETETNPKQ